MTTIAYKAGVLAADSLCTSNGFREGDALKIRKIGRLLVAGCGASARCERFFDWVAAGMNGESPWTGHDSGNSLIVLPDDTLVMFGENGPWPLQADFYALGSGELIALGAMAAGASAAEAVAHAIRFDTRSGGPIRTISR